MKISDFDFGQLIGRGGFSSVYRAHSRVTNSDVAIKVIEKRRMEELNMVEKVESEIRIHSSVSYNRPHENITRLYGTFEDDTCYYLVMELCLNGNLYKEMKVRAQQGKLEENRARDIIYQLLLALQHLHRKGIVHRDLKLSNVLLFENNQDSSKGKRNKNASSEVNQIEIEKEEEEEEEEEGVPLIKLCDFGLAVQIEHPDEEHFTLCGTPNYIAPEIAAHRSHSSPADLWSAGCLLYSLLVGALPFQQQENEANRNRDVDSSGSGNNGSMSPAQSRRSSPSPVPVPASLSPQERQMEKEKERGAAVRRTLSKIKRRDLNPIPPAVLLSLTQPCKDCLDSLLCSDPDMRPSAEEALADPFFLPCRKRDYQRQIQQMQQRSKFSSKCDEERERRHREVDVVGLLAEAGEVEPLESLSTPTAKHSVGSRSRGPSTFPTLVAPSISSSNSNCGSRAVPRADHDFQDFRDCTVGGLGSHNEREREGAIGGNCERDGGEDSTCYDYYNDCDWEEDEDEDCSGRENNENEGDTTHEEQGEEEVDVHDVSGIDFGAFYAGEEEPASEKKMKMILTETAINSDDGEEDDESTVHAPRPSADPELSVYSHRQGKLGNGGAHIHTHTHDQDNNRNRGLAKDKEKFVPKRDQRDKRDYQKYPPGCSDGSSGLGLTSSGSNSSNSGTPSSEQGVNISQRATQDWGRPNTRHRHRHAQGTPSPTTAAPASIINTTATTTTGGGGGMAISGLKREVEGQRHSRNEHNGHAVQAPTALRNSAGLGWLHQLSSLRASLSHSASPNTQTRLPLRESYTYRSDAENINDISTRADTNTSSRARSPLQELPLSQYAQDTQEAQYTQDIQVRASTSSSLTDATDATDSTHSGEQGYEASQGNHANRAELETSPTSFLRASALQLSSSNGALYSSRGSMSMSHMSHVASSSSNYGNHSNHGYDSHNDHRWHQPTQNVSQGSKNSFTPHAHANRSAHSHTSASMSRSISDSPSQPPPRLWTSVANQMGPFCYVVPSSNDNASNGSNEASSSRAGQTQTQLYKEVVLLSPEKDLLYLVPIACNSSNNGQAQGSKGPTFTYARLLLRHDSPLVLRVGRVNRHLEREIQRLVRDGSIFGGAGLTRAVLDVLKSDKEDYADYSSSASGSRSKLWAHKHQLARLPTAIRAAYDRMLQILQVLRARSPRSILYLRRGAVLDSLLSKEKGHPIRDTIDYGDKYGGEGEVEVGVNQGSASVTLTETEDAGEGGKGNVEEEEEEEVEEEAIFVATDLSPLEREAEAEGFDLLSEISTTARAPAAMHTHLALTEPQSMYSQHSGVTTNAGSCTSATTGDSGTTGIIGQSTSASPSESNAMQRVTQPQQAAASTADTRTRVIRAEKERESIECKCTVMSNGSLPDFCVQWAPSSDKAGVGDNADAAYLTYSLRTGRVRVDLPAGLPVPGSLPFLVSLQDCDTDTGTDTDTGADAAKGSFLFHDKEEEEDGALDGFVKDADGVIVMHSPALQANTNTNRNSTGAMKRDWSRSSPVRWEGNLLAAGSSWAQAQDAVPLRVKGYVQIAQMALGMMLPRDSSGVQ